jgi:hypothetical protein
MEKFSIVIPTMWKSPLIHDMIPVYLGSDYIDEIIIINNTPDDVRYEEAKIKVCNMGKNTYVNPAWNYGNKVRKQSNTLILANDDLLINGLDEMLLLVERAPFELFGASVNTPDTPCLLSKIKKGVVFPRNHFGCFMVVRRYNEIPKQLQIMCGDDYLYYKAQSVAIIKGPFISTPGSATVSLGFGSIKRKDHVYFNKIKRRLRSGRCLHL